MSLLLSVDFGSAFDIVNHEALFFKLKSTRVGGHVFEMTSIFFRHETACSSWLLFRYF